MWWQTQLVWLCINQFAHCIDTRPAWADSSLFPLLSRRQPQKNSQPQKNPQLRHNDLTTLSFHFSPMVPSGYDAWPSLPPPKHSRAQQHLATRQFFNSSEVKLDPAPQTHPHNAARDRSDLYMESDASLKCLKEEETARILCTYQCTVSDSSQNLASILLPIYYFICNLVIHLGAAPSKA